MKESLFGLLLLASGSGFTQCVLPVDKANFSVVEIEGKAHYVINKQSADQFDCVDLEEINDQLKRINQLEAMVQNYQSLSGDLANNVEGYRQVNSDLNITLDRSIDLSNRYADQIQQFDQLSSQYNDLAKRYDDLTETYRDIAMNRSSFISMDAGVGLSEDGDLMGLIGVGFKNLRAWGVAQEDNNGLILGGSFPF